MSERKRTFDTWIWYKGVQNLISGGSVRDRNLPNGSDAAVLNSSSKVAKKGCDQQKIGIAQRFSSLNRYKKR